MRGFAANASPSTYVSITMFTKILIVLTALLAVFAVVVSLRPSHFLVERSITISGPADAIYPKVVSHKAWEAWSPFMKADPAMKVSLEGTDGSLGSACVFAGPKSGEGRSTLVSMRPHEEIQFRLDMLKPMRAANDVVFTFKPAPLGTVVTWRMSGEANFVMKAFGLFVDCDKMIGPQFEQGLADLKRIVESSRGPLQTAKL